MDANEVLNALSRLEAQVDQLDHGRWNDNNWRTYSEALAIIRAALASAPRAAEAEMREEDCTDGKCRNQMECKWPKCSRLYPAQAAAPCPADGQPCFIDYCKEHPCAAHRGGASDVQRVARPEFRHAHQRHALAGVRHQGTTRPTGPRAADHQGANVKHFNGLTPAEHERLALLLEELGEAQQAIGKILRHGYNSHDPTSSSHPGNRYDLAKECGDVMAEIGRLVEAGDISKGEVEKRATKRATSALQYCHHQPDPPRDAQSSRTR